MNGMSDGALRFRGALSSRLARSGRPNVSIEGGGQRKGAAAQRCALIVSACCGVWAASINVGKNGSSVREMADVTALI
jgi:hypothetical protein